MRRASVQPYWIGGQGPLLSQCLELAAAKACDAFRVCCGCDTFLLVLRHQLFGDRRETVARTYTGSDSSLPLGGIGIDGMGQLLLRLIPCRSRAGERFRSTPCKRYLTRQSLLPIGWTKR